MQPLSAAHAALLLLLLLWAGGCATRAVPGSANSPPELPVSVHRVAHPPRLRSPGAPPAVPWWASCLLFSSVNTATAREQPPFRIVRQALAPLITVTHSPAGVSPQQGASQAPHRRGEHAGPAHGTLGMGDAKLGPSSRWRACLAPVQQRCRCSGSAWSCLKLNSADRGWV